MNRDMIRAEDTFRKTDYRIEYGEDGVYLTVSPSEHGLTKEDETRILQYIKRKKIMDISSTAVFQAMYVEPSNRIKVADAQKEEILDQEIEVRIGKGGMEAYAMLLPADGGKNLSLESAKKTLNREGIVFGIDEKAIENMLKQKDYYKEIPIARGKEPQDGKDAELKYHIDLNRTGKPEIMEDGTVDYRHLDLIENVKKGQLLVSITPPTKGIPGKTVTGKDIMAKSGKNVPLPRGKNVILTEDRLSLLAGVDGKAEIINEKIHIYAVYEVQGNVDNSTGNIDFIGNIIINGNVLTGFEVKSGGYIEVRGVVEGAKLSAKGDVVLKQGMQGMGKGTIQSEGDVIARFIENGVVTAKGNIIAEAIMHSEVNCGGKVEVAGKKGLIVGGSVSAGIEISAIVIGSPMATITELEVGTSPLLREEYSLLISELERLEQELRKADQILNLLNKMESKRELPANKVNMRLKTIRTKLIHYEKIPGIRARITELEEIFKAVSMGKINVRKTIYPGVKVIIGSSTQYIKDEEKYVTFKREHGNVVRTSFLG